MTGIAIYMEGGGNGPGTKAALRQGMDAFLTAVKNAARAKAWRWKLVCCGGRREAFDAFLHARRSRDMSVVVLLVDSERPVTASPCAHLAARDGWDLKGVSDDLVHLMVQVMESWIVADVDALAAYYRQGFNANLLPKAKNLETVAKSTVATSLERATCATQKGAYHKVRHASDLLMIIDPAKVRQRCPSCARMFQRLQALIVQA